MKDNNQTEKEEEGNGSTSIPAIPARSRQIFYLKKKTAGGCRECPFKDGSGNCPLSCNAR